MSTQTQPQIHAIIRRNQLDGGDVFIAWLSLFILNSLIWLFFGWSLVGWVLRTWILFHALSTTVDYFASGTSAVIVGEERSETESEKAAPAEQQHSTLPLKVEVRQRTIQSQIPIETPATAPIADETTIIHHGNETTRPGIQFCPSCGSELLYPNSAFCASCGLKL